MNDINDIIDITDTGCIYLYFSPTEAINKITIKAVATEEKEVQKQRSKIFILNFLLKIHKKDEIKNNIIEITINTNILICGNKSFIKIKICSLAGVNTIGELVL